MMGKREVNWMPNLHPKKKQKNKRNLFEPFIRLLENQWFFFFWAITLGVKWILGIEFCKLKIFFGAVWRAFRQPTRWGTYYWIGDVTLVMWSWWFDDVELMTQQTFLVLPVGKYYKISGEFDSIYNLQGNSPHRDRFRVCPKP